MSAEDFEQQISEKKERFASVKTDIMSTTESIKDLNIKIAKVENDISKYKGANKLFEALKNTSEIVRAPAQPQMASVELNDEHLEIIAKKRSAIRPLKDKMKNLSRQQEVLENQLFDTRLDISEELNEICCLKEALRETSDKSTYIQAKNAWLRDQLSETINEKKQFNQMRREAEAALASLKERAVSNTTLEGGRLDLEKSICSLQDQYNSLKVEIDKLKGELNQIAKDKQQMNEDKEKQSKEIKSSVNWENEKQQLKKELADITEQLANRKKEVTSKEKVASRETNHYEKYAQYVKKWSLKLNETELPSESVSALYDSLNASKEEIANKLQEKNERMSQLVIENAKLEKELSRKKKALNRVVDQFHSDESTMKKSTEEKRRKFQEEEKKLLAQIDEAKIKLAQKYLQVE